MHLSSPLRTSGSHPYAAASGSALDEFLRQETSWRNTQDIIRQTFKAVSDVLRAQGEAVRRVEDDGDQLRNATDASHKRILDQVASQARDTDRLLASKLSTDDFAATHRDLLDAVSQCRNEVARKADAAHVEAQLDARPTRAVMNNELDRIRIETESTLRAAVTPLLDAVESLRQSVHETATRAEKDAEATSQALKAISSTFDNFEAAVTGLRQRTDKIDATLQRLPEVESGLASLRQRLDAVREELVPGVDESRRAVYSLSEELRGLVEAYSEVRRSTSDVDRIRHDLSQLGLALQDRPTSQEVCALLDTKANIHDLNRTLSDMCRDIESKVSNEEFGRMARQQANWTASLAQEMSMGRWLWKSSKTKAGGVVPWNVEVVNTDAENFTWAADKGYIVANVPGLYEISIGFFARRTPKVQLLVDGQAVLACLNSSSYVLHHSSGKLTSKTHPAGTVTGLTMIDFLALPPKAKLSIVYQGDEMGEGFLQLKKL